MVREEVGWKTYGCEGSEDYLVQYPPGIISPTEYARIFENGADEGADGEFRNWDSLAEIRDGVGEEMRREVARAEVSPRVACTFDDLID